MTCSRLCILSPCSLLLLTHSLDTLSSFLFISLHFVVSNAPLTSLLRVLWVFLWTVIFCYLVISVCLLISSVWLYSCLPVCLSVCHSVSQPLVFIYPLFLCNNLLLLLLCVCVCVCVCVSCVWVRERMCLSHLSSLSMCTGAVIMILWVFIQNHQFSLDKQQEGLYRSISMQHFTLKPHLILKEM